MSKKRILVIEDDFHIREILQDFLQMENYEVLTAENGKLGLEVLKHCDREPDLILLDLMMPIMDGMTFRLHQLENAQFKKIPVISMSANSQYNSQVALNTHAHLKKPIEINDLMHLMESFFNQQSVP